jgi:hypothetical protein
VPPVRWHSQPTLEFLSVGKIIETDLAQILNKLDGRFDNYFYANLLMVECKKAAVRVSRKTWSEIESRMLMPFRE